MLKIEVAGVGGGVVYFVDFFVAAAKGALIFKVSVYENGKGGFKGNARVLLAKFDFNKPKTGLTPFLVAVGRKGDFKIPPVLTIFSGSRNFLTLSSEAT